MPIDKDLIGRLRARGEEVFTQVSAELMQNPRFMKAMEGALRGKEKMEDVVRQALKKADIPTRTEFKKAVARIDTLEDELATLRKKMASAAKPRGTRGKKATRGTASTARKSAKKTG